MSNVNTDPSYAEEAAAHYAAQETRVVDPETGGEKGEKPCKLTAIDPLALEQLGLVAGYGTEKYARWNYLKGYKFSSSTDAAARHMLRFLAGESFDPESGHHHMAHVAWHGLCAVSFDLRGIGTDDRAPRFPELF